MRTVVRGLNPAIAPPACHGWEGPLSVIPEHTRVLQAPAPLTHRGPQRLSAPSGTLRLVSVSRTGGSVPEKVLEEKPSLGRWDAVILDVGPMTAAWLEALCVHLSHGLRPAVAQEQITNQLRAS